MCSRNCIISAVGKDSLHKAWTKGKVDFDLHLIVYDGSLESFRNDAKYVCHIKGFKLKIIYKYLEQNPHLKVKYDYYFLPDDDMLMDADAISRLFAAMRHYNLQIAQPSLRMSYYSWPHTLYDRYSKLRYTNFVEMMVPCFSRKALNTVLFTFNENETGWGTETHWPLLINAGQRGMAIVDEVCVKHMRPVQSGQSIHKNELDAYLRKYNLRTVHDDYEALPSQAASDYCCDRKSFYALLDTLLHLIRGTAISCQHIGMNGYYGWVYFLALLAGITQARKYADAAIGMLSKIQTHTRLLKEDMSFSRGITGCCWLIEFLASEGVLQEDPEELLEEADTHIRQYKEKHDHMLTLTELAGIGKYYLAKYRARGRQKDKTALCNLLPLINTRLSNCGNNESVNVLLDLTEILDECDADISMLIKSLMRMASARDNSKVEHAYCLYRLYRLTDDRNLLYHIRECLGKHIVQPTCLSEALMLAEMIHHRPQ